MEDQQRTVNANIGLVRNVVLVILRSIIALALNST